MQTIYTRLNMSHNSTKSTANRYVTVSAHFYPGLFLQLGSWSNLQVGYQISTGRPRLKRNHRQEGIPPSWLRLIVSACQCRTDYRCLRNAIVGMRGYSASEAGALQHIYDCRDPEGVTWCAKMARSEQALEGIRRSLSYQE